MTIQTRQVSPEIAELILAKVKANGSVAKAHCANSISKLLGDVPGFENISTTYFPKALAKDFASYPNVSLRTVTDANVDTSHGVIFIDPKDFDGAQAANAGL